jgi:hypothetical protein|tara:strand:+ start:149 stop:613 length:465 start_codon:yes stop_codon:yes gene_type:complete
MTNNLREVINTVVVAASVGVATFAYSTTQLNPENVGPVTANVVASESPIDVVKLEYNKIESDEDRQLIYKLFGGAAEYLRAAETLSGTQSFGPILGKVQTTYGWEREKYPAFTDAVSDFLVSVDFNTPKELDTARAREDFAKIFDELAEATKYE